MRGKQNFASIKDIILIFVRSIIVAILYVIVVRLVALSEQCRNTVVANL